MKEKRVVEKYYFIDDRFQVGNIKLQLVVFRVIKFTEVAIDVRWSVAACVRYEQRDEFWRHIIVFRVVNADLAEDVTIRILEHSVGGEEGVERRLVG